MDAKSEYYTIYINKLLPPLGMLSIRHMSHTINEECMHRNYHIIYILSGSAEITFSNTTIKASKGKAFIVPPNFKYNITRNVGCSHFDIILSVWDKSSENIWKFFTELTKKGIVFTPTLYFEYTFDDLKILFALPTEINCYSLNVKANSILLSVLEQSFSDNVSDFKRKIAEITALNKNSLTLKELCELSGYSPTHFERLMMQNFGVSGIEYFNKIKLERICNLLKTTDLNLKEIAEKLEFYDTSHLNTFFKKRMGITPGKYRKDGNKYPY